MRPLDKGNVPTNDSGTAVQPGDYKQWRRYLIERIGYFCAYCNQPLSHSLQVEHVIPVNPRENELRGDMLDWNNVLLACGPCNNAKSNICIDAKEFYLPENHNTHLPFTVSSIDESEHAVVIARENLSAYQSEKANRTIKLFKLDNIDRRNNITDIRSLKRKKALITVKGTKEIFNLAKESEKFDPCKAAEYIAQIALATGFFGLWYEEFLSEPHVMEKLVDNSIIQGTALDCFDPDNGYTLKYRNPENPSDSI